MQLVGSPERATLDINALTSIGVKTVGRLAGVNDGKAQFSGSLRNQCALSDLKNGQTSGRHRSMGDRQRHERRGREPMRFAPTMVEDSPPLGLDLTRVKSKPIVWATGYRPDTSWLHVPIMDRKGRIRHDGGVTESPGMYLWACNSFVGETRL